MGIAEAVACEGGVGGDVEMPAGDPMEAGNIKSSMFIASGSVLFVDKSVDSRSFAIPDGALVGCWLALHTLLKSIQGSSLCPLFNDIPCLLSFLALQIHGHHAPCQVFHALLVG